MALIPAIIALYNWQLNRPYQHYAKSLRMQQCGKRLGNCISQVKPPTVGGPNNITVLKLY